MTFSTYRFQSHISAVIISVVILLSFQVKVGMACETKHKSENVMPHKIHHAKTHSAGVLPIKDIALARVQGKRAWIKKNTPLKINRSVTSDYVIRMKIRRVINRYKTGMTEHKKNQISRHILKQSKKYGYDPLFLTALIITESSFNHRAKSKAGALGLMQIRLNTGKAMASESNIKWRGTRTLYLPEKNIALGTYYLSKMLDRFGNMKTALEAYNHGPTRTARYLRRGKRTHKYSGKVFAMYHKIRLAQVAL